jgi:hypothetical protein
MRRSVQIARELPRILSYTYLEGSLFLVLGQEVEKNFRLTRVLFYTSYKFFAKKSFCCFFKETKNEDKMKTPVPGAGFASSRKSRHTPEPKAGRV